MIVPELSSSILYLFVIQYITEKTTMSIFLTPNISYDFQLSLLSSFDNNVYATVPKALIVTQIIPIILLRVLVSVIPLFPK
ncbi:hypothetical protein VSA01S_37380 [Vibrio sagamiensis NBRC 104589]|uniref:Uncharacterized protein n=1 Tax=Vibrio sagamiensis NBRC 104589 TaxID=1219064 RepID=A0A511QKQ2_9VIBR|nr:hypothetical protein VSA01S_37380 [Vibrio sagamiensis NBRC 104589]